MSDDTLMTTNLGGGQMVVPGLTSWTTPNLALTNGLVVFPSGVDVTVLTNLNTLADGAISLSNAVLTVGGDATLGADDEIASWIEAGERSQMVVAGNLYLDGGHLALQSTSSNRTENRENPS